MLFPEWFQEDGEVVIGGGGGGRYYISLWFQLCFLFFLFFSE